MLSPAAQLHQTFLSGQVRLAGTATSTCTFLVSLAGAGLAVMVSAGPDGHDSNVCGGLAFLVRFIHALLDVTSGYPTFLIKVKIVI